VANGRKIVKRFVVDDSDLTLCECKGYFKTYDTLTGKVTSFFTNNRLYGMSRVFENREQAVELYTSLLTALLSSCEDKIATLQDQAESLRNKLKEITN
jgi:DNA-binding transcriptional MerR regulator